MKQTARADSANMLYMSTAYHIVSSGNITSFVSSEEATSANVTGRTTTNNHAT